MENKDNASKSVNASTLTPPNMQGNVSEPKVMKEFPSSNSKGKSSFKMPMWVITILVVIAGVGTGWFLSGMTSQSTNTIDSSMTTKEDKKTASGEAGILVDDVEYEEVEGMLEEGGIDGEGTHHLVRDPNNKTQDVYLTSSTLDLQGYVGKKVRIWGITISGQKAGWLMEVGKIKSL